MSHKSTRIMLTLAIAVILAAALSMSRPAHAAGMIVNSTGDTTADDGACTLREAVDNANNDAAAFGSPGECASGSGADTITFSVGGTITLTAGEIAISSDMTIDGAGAVAVSGGGVSRVFNISSGTVTISGLTIQNGAAGVANGGGILNGGALAITGSILTANSANRGGGIYNAAGGSLAVTNSAFSGNTITGLGAGAGIFNFNGAMTVTGSTFSGNIASAQGGGIFNGGSLTVANSTFSGNTGGAFGGGGILNAGLLTVTNSTFSGNSGPSQGGGIYNVDALATVTNSTFTGNTANFGAAISGSDSDDTVTVTGSLFSGNMGANGSAFYTRSGSISASCIQGNSTTNQDVQNGSGGAFTAEGNWWGVATGPNTTGETTNIAVTTYLTEAPPCGAAGIVTKDVCNDGRINCHHGDWLAVVYTGKDNFGGAAIDIYCVDLAGKGYFGMQVTQADIDQFPANPEVDTLVKEAGNCRVPVRFYILTTGEYQINIGPDYESKVEVVVFTGLPPANIYFLRFTEE